MIVSDFWLAGLLLLTGLGALAYAAQRYRAGRGPAWGWLLLGAAAACSGLGGVIPLPEPADHVVTAWTTDIFLWLAVTAAVLFLGKLVYLVLSGHWWAP